MGAIGYIAGAVAITTLIGAVALWARRRDSTEKGKSAHTYPHGGEIADLNRLLQEGAISPEEHELIKRRILAGQVY